GSRSASAKRSISRSNRHRREHSGSTCAARAGNGGSRCECRSCVDEASRLVGAGEVEASTKAWDRGSPGDRDEEMPSVGCDAKELKAGKHQQHAIRISNLEHP